MRTLILGFAAVSLVAGPAAATARGESAAPAAATAKSNAKAEKKVCKRLEQSGTRFAEKVCLTKAEWDRIEREG